MSPARISLRLDRSLHSALCDRAQHHRRSLNSEMTWRLQSSLDQYDPARCSEVAPLCESEWLLLAKFRRLPASQRAAITALLSSAT